MRMRFRNAWLLAALSLLVGCEQPPTLRLVADPLAPAPPTAAGFGLLPTDSEVLEHLERRFPDASTIELIGEPTGDVLWLAEHARHYWVYPRPSRVIVEGFASPLGNLEQLVSDGVRYEFWGDKWQPGGMWHGVTRYRGLDDPDEAQLIALLQAPGINYHEHFLAGAPTDIEFDQPPAFERDAEGFAEPRLGVEFRARVQKIAFGEGQLQTADARIRAQVYVDVREGRWRVAERIEMLDLQPKYSEDLDSDELTRLHWAMRDFWKRN